MCQRIKNSFQFIKSLATCADGLKDLNKMILTSASAKGLCMTPSYAGLCCTSFVYGDK